MALHPAPACERCRSRSVVSERGGLTNTCLACGHRVGDDVDDVSIGSTLSATFTPNRARGRYFLTNDQDEEERTAQ